MTATHVSMLCGGLGLTIWGYWWQWVRPSYNSALSFIRGAVAIAIGAGLIVVSGGELLLSLNIL